MSRINLSKAALHKETARLKLYRKYLPSLDLKRQQLLLERNKADRVLVELQDHWRALETEVKTQLPMLAEPGFSLANLQVIERVEIEQENRVGVMLPVFKQIHFQPAQYSLLARPHWLDRTQELLTSALELAVKEKIARQRRQVIALALKKVTQKVNLFEKVLIPKSQDTIRKIRIFLGDAERAAVVRAKITKKMREDKAA